MSRLVIENRYEVYLDRPLTHFNRPQAHAYLAKDLCQQAQLDFIAYRTQIFPTPRLELFDAFKNIARHQSHLRMMHLQGAQNVAWPGSGIQKSFALVFSKPKGAPIMKSLEETLVPWTQEKVFHLVISPFLELLEKIGPLGIGYRSISPLNMYLEENGKHSIVVLGECLTSPVGFDQPIFFEPNEYALADPVGRGESGISPDLFALGATIAFLLQGGNPCRGIPEREVLSRRLQYGTFHTYVNKTLISTKYQELLKGLLCDSEEHRWTLKDLRHWHEAGRGVSAQNSQPKKASRPIEFNGRSDIYTMGVLCHEMRQNPMGTVELIGKNYLLTWLKNSLNATGILHTLESLKLILPENASNDEKILWLLQVLDPTGPFYWRGRHFREKGMALCLAQAVYRQEPLDTFIQLIMSPVFSFFLADDISANSSMAMEERPEGAFLPRGNKIKLARTFLDFQQMGWGIERCVYYLAPHLPCFSPIVLNHNCTTVKEVLDALNQIALLPTRPEFPLDGHILSFILSHERRLQGQYLLDFDSQRGNKKVISIFRLFSELQDRHKIENLSGLCQWLFQLSDPILETYRNKKRREELKKNLHEMIPTGQLLSMVNLLDNRRAMEQDYTSYRQAQAEFNFLESNVARIFASFSTPVHYSIGIGQNNAVLISGLVSFACMISYMMLRAIL